MIQAIDAPIAPGSRGGVAYQWLQEGKSLEVRQTFRERLLQLSKQDVVEAVKAIILPAAKNGAAVCMASQELFEQENQKRQERGETPLPLFSLDEGFGK